MSDTIIQIEALLLKMSERADRLEVENEVRARENEARAKENEERAKENELKFKKWDEDFEKTKAENAKSKKEADKSMRKLERTMDGFGYTQGMISEELVLSNFQDVLNETGENISSINNNVEAYVGNKIVAEFDIIGVNGTKVFVGETKTKLTKKHVDKFIEETLVKFEKYLLEKRYGGLKLYGVIGARVFANKGVEEYAISKGLYVMKENNKGAMKMIKESVKNVKAFA